MDGPQLRLLREELRLSQKRLGVVLGLQGDPAKSIRQMETGKSTISGPVATAVLYMALWRRQRETMLRLRAHLRAGGYDLAWLHAQLDSAIGGASAGPAPAAGTAGRPQGLEGLGERQWQCLEALVRGRAWSYESGWAIEPPGTPPTCPESRSATRGLLEGLVRRGLAEREDDDAAMRYRPTDQGRQAVLDSWRTLAAAFAEAPEKKGGAAHDDAAKAP